MSSPHHLHSRQNSASFVPAITMFGFGAGKSAYPNVYSITAAKQVSKEISSKSSSTSTSISTSTSTSNSTDELTHSIDSLEPAIDGPPSPEHIRAYTERMKRGSIFGNNSRTNTLSSGSSSFRSRESVTVSTESLSLSRKSSVRSTTSSMPSARGERPDSVQIFGRALFSRRGRRSKNGLGSPSSLGGEITEEGSARDHYHSSGRRGTFSSQDARKLISGPYNFQHVTHTGQNQVPNLEQVSQVELVSEFSAIKAAQSPTKGELKGIRAQDLHFDNFSSEALAVEQSGPSPTSNPLHTPSLSPPRAVTYAKSHDNIRSPPPRPPRSPLSPTCPVALPVRMSSRTASVLYDEFDPLATTTITRPHTNSGFRKPAPFAIQLPRSPTWNEEESDFTPDPLAHAVTTPNEEAWPLPASPTNNFGAELSDVAEEDEETHKRRSRASLRFSQSVPALRLRSLADARTESPTLEMEAPPQRRPLSPGFYLGEDSWDNAIDYAYDHEAEADCDYQWDTNSHSPATTVAAPSPALDLHLESSQRPYAGRFRPSLLVPSTSDLPELSPISSDSIISTDPQTPAFPQSGHQRSQSHASSFKESHGFNLSPSLLIPGDFQAQMELFDSYHDSMYGHDSTSSTASFRSSDFSRASARSSSSTRMSDQPDDFVSLKRAGSTTQNSRGFGSADSLPDLVRGVPAEAGNENVTVSPLSPVVEESRGIHNRKISAPVPSSAKEFKGRARAASSVVGGRKAGRASYALFPQV